MVGSRKRQDGDLAAIFVHAGAGYHSLGNEKIHLEACAGAARAAMTFLKNGATAVDAVEVAIKVLEDKEITNAGYGSNLTLDGVVECDATLVDHLGRSGAVGAMGQVLNPIHVARLVLEESTKPLSLRRVPPNLLVGQGATDFAFDHGVPILPPSYLVSGGARERYKRWKKDIEAARRFEELQSTSGSDHGDLSPVEQAPLLEIARAENPSTAALRNESQPFSPRLGATAVESDGDVNQPILRSPARSTRGSSSSRGLTPQPSPLQQEFYTDAANNSGHSHDGQSAESEESLINPELVLIQRVSWASASTSSVASSSGLSAIDPTFEIMDPYHGLQDVITDTVGAIAIDSSGNIAAGSSSGGIGMKHKGRTGPAALVGIGTAVIPIRANDRDKTCVAAVTSGTGEHMATTMAASLCASRLYSSTKSDRHSKVVETDEDSALQSFVEHDFMGHPSVKNSHSAGAIGVMSVKKTVDGMWLYFAHNTDSFALASMHSDELEPMTVMSRTKGSRKVTTGGRSMRWSNPSESKAKRQRKSSISRTNRTLSATLGSAMTTSGGMAFSGS